MAWKEFLEHLGQCQFCCPGSQIQTTDVCFVLSHICSIGTTQQAPLCDFYQYIPSPQSLISRELKGLNSHDQPIATSYRFYTYLQKLPAAHRSVSRLSSVERGFAHENQYKHLHLEDKEGAADSTGWRELHCAGKHQVIVH